MMRLCDYPKLDDRPRDMLRRTLIMDLGGPSIIVSLVLFVVCLAAAGYLYVTQSTTTEILGEDIESRKYAQDLETTLKSLATLLRKGHEQVEQLNQEAETQLDLCREHANKPREEVLVQHLNQSWEQFNDTWDARTSKSGAERTARVVLAAKILEEDALPACRQLRTYNAAEIEKSDAAHRRIARWMLPGFALVGIIGSFNGLYLGYTVARRLRRSVHQLSVIARDAANRLGQDLPTLTIVEDGDLQHVNEQMKSVVTEIETVVDRLQQREREVLRAEQLAAVGQLAAGMAHELRNPLTSIKLLVETNREEANQRGVPSEDLNLIEQEIRRMERCLKHFLDFARPPKLERRLIALRSVIERSLALVAGRARKQQVATIYQPDEEQIEADPELLQQLFVNLLLNALDAMPTGGELRVDVHAKGRGKIEISVMDTGPGINDGLKNTLFQPFVSSKETGLGLGLSISHRIAESHGGTLEVSNRPQGGACFRLTLPANQFAPLAV